MYKKRYIILLTIILFLFISIGTVATQNINKSLTVDKQNNIEPTIHELINSTDRQSYAENHNIDYKNNKVKLIIELKENTHLPSQYNITEIQRYTGQRENLLQGYIPIDRIKNLSNHQNVIDIRLPMEAQPAKNNVQTQQNTTNTTKKEDNTQPQTSIFGTILPAIATILSLSIYKYRKQK